MKTVKGIYQICANKFTSLRPDLGPNRLQSLSADHISCPLISKEIVQG